MTHACFFQVRRHRAPQLNSADRRRLQDDRVRAGVERPGAEQLRPGQDDGERLQGALRRRSTHRNICKRARAIEKTEKEMQWINW